MSSKCPSCGEQVFAPGLCTDCVKCKCGRYRIESEACSHCHFDPVLDDCEDKLDGMQKYRKQVEQGKAGGWPWSEGPAHYAVIGRRYDN